MSPLVLSASCFGCYCSERFAASGTIIDLDVFVTSRLPSDQLDFQISSTFIEGLFLLVGTELEGEPPVKGRVSIKK